MIQLKEKDAEKLNFILSLLRIKEVDKAEALLHSFIKEFNIETDWKYVDVNEAARLKNKSVKTIRRMVENEQVPYYRNGKGGKLFVGIKTNNLPANWLENLGLMEEDNE